MNALFINGMHHGQWTRLNPHTFRLIVLSYICYRIVATSGYRYTYYLLHNFDNTFYVLDTTPYRLVKEDMSYVF